MKTAKINHKFTIVIATKEMSAGNESVGTMWNETKSFHVNEPISRIMEWGEKSNGKLILTYDESSEVENK